MPLGYEPDVTMIGSSFGVCTDQRGTISAYLGLLDTIPLSIMKVYVGTTRWHWLISTDIQKPHGSGALKLSGSDLYFTLPG